MSRHVSERIYGIVLSFWIVVAFYSKRAVCQLNAEGRIIRSLARHDDYEPQARPVRNPTSAIEVSINLALRGIVKFNDEEQVIAIHTFLDTYWVDDFVSWDPKEYDNVTNVWVSTEKFWKPDIALVASLGGVFDLVNQQDISIMAAAKDGGMALLSSPVLVRACDLDMTFFPFDIQVCNFTFESKNYDSTKLMLYPGENSTINIDDFRKTPDGLWDVTSAIVFSEVNDLNWSVLVAEFTFKRKPWYYMLNIIIPCVFISFLVPLVFYIPPGSGEKVSMSVTILLAFSVFQLVIADNLPKTSDNTPVIVEYLLCQLILAAVAVILTVIVLHIHLKEGATMPSWLHSLVFSYLARAVCMGASKKRILYPELLPDGGKYNNGFSGADDIVMENVDDKTYDRDAEPTAYYLNQIVKFLREKDDLRKDVQKQELIKSVWMEAAEVLDRFLMIVYCIINIASVIGFLGIVPYLSYDKPHTAPPG